MTGNLIKPWVESLDSSAIGEHLERIDAEIAALQSERGWLLEGLEFKHRWDEAQSGGPNAAPPPRAVPEAHFPLDGGPPIRTKTEGLLRVMGSDPHREWTTPDIAEIMIKKGWMDDSEGDHASLTSTLSRLVGESRIHRPQRGRYRLAPTS